MTRIAHDCAVPMDIEIPDDVSVYITVWKCPVCNARWRVKHRRGGAEATCVKQSSSRWATQKEAEIREQNVDHATGIRAALARIARLDSKGNLRD